MGMNHYLCLGDWNMQAQKWPCSRSHKKVRGRATNGIQVILCQGDRCPSVPLWSLGSSGVCYPRKVERPEIERKSWPRSLLQQGALGKRGARHSIWEQVITLGFTWSWREERKGVEFSAKKDMLTPEDQELGDQAIALWVKNVGTEKSRLL